MKTKFVLVDKVIKDKNLKVTPRCGEFIIFSHKYYLVVSVEHNYDDNYIIVRLNSTE